MPTFKLIFRDDSCGVAKTMEFEAQTAGSAFNVLEGERHSRRVELWTAGEMLAEIVRDRSGVWQLDTQNSSPQGAS